MSDGTREHDTGAEGRRGDGDNSLTLVESLMAERRKFEQWLSALEARRATTPERVFTRVHADYHDRLDAVVEQLKEHTEGLRAELASLTLRLTAIEESSSSGATSAPRRSFGPTSASCRRRRGSTSPARPISPSKA